MKEFVNKYKYQIIITLLFIIGFATRLAAITKYPAGFNQDEASAGYDAWSILKYGIDRNGRSFPVHLIAWGSGQNVLYSYLMIPFISIFGLNELSVRLPMAIIGCISLVVIYKLLLKYNKKLAIIGLTFFTICPWHIMKSRWGLESNIFPDLVLWAVYFILIGLKDNKIFKFYIGMAILSLSVYSYGTSYLFLPIFIISVILYLLITKRIKIKHAIISAIIVLIIVMPMILFVVINTFELNELKLGIITIPREYQNRYEDVTNGNIFSNIMHNAKVLLYQTDGTKYNSIEFYGIIYLLSLPFAIIGIWNSFQKRGLERTILNLWFIAAIVVFIALNEANINRLNIIIIPLILYTILGIYQITENDKNTIVPIIAIYTILFGFFTVKYIQTQGYKNSVFLKDYKEALQYANSLNTEKIYIDNSFNQPYIYTLFYTKTPTNKYIETVEYSKQKVAFEKIKSFDKYYFYLPKDKEKGDVYIVKSTYKYNENLYKEKDFGKFKVLQLREE